MTDRKEQLSAAERVAAVAGRRPDTSSHERRFPAETVPRVTAEIQDLLVAYHVHTVVCSAAAGADLLALHAAREIGIRQSVVLPFPVDEFRKTSVADRGQEWLALFDELMSSVTASGELVVLDGTPGAEAAYRGANHEILRRARAAAQFVDPLVAPVALAVWDGKRRPSRDLTSEFIEEARRDGFQVVEVLTTDTSRRL